MVFYIASDFYTQVIKTSITSVEGEFIAGGESASSHSDIDTEGVDHGLFLKEILRKPISWDVINKLVLDLSVINEPDSDLIDLLESFRLEHDSVRVILFAPNKQSGDNLLSECVSMGIFDIICNKNPYEIKEELISCIKEPRAYKDAVIYKVKKIEKTPSKEDSLEQDNPPKDIEIKTKSLKQEEKTVTSTSRNKVIIGVAGAQAHIGVTHTCIQLASYLKSQEQKVAVIECHKSNDFLRLREGFDIEIDDGKFIIEDMDFYEKKDAIDISDILAKDYNFIIIDFGCYKECDRITFEKSDVKLIVSGAKAWEIDSLNENVFPYADIDTLKKYHYLFNHATDHVKKDISFSMKNLGGALFLQYSVDPFKPEFPIADFILKGMIPKQNKQKKKQGLLGGLLNVK